MIFLNVKSDFPVEIAEKKLFIIDLDGTIYIDDKLIYNAKGFLSNLKAEGREFVFLTNNSSRSKQQYMRKLNSLGLAPREENIFSSNEATALYLTQNFAGKKVLYMGTFDSAKEMKDWGVDILLPFERNKDKAIDVAVLAYDTGMTYDKLCVFCLAVRRGIPYISTHPDYNCPSSEGPLPDNGSFIELIKASTGRVPDKIIGKPNHEMIDILCDKFKVEKKDVAVIGDRLYTDIRMGLDNGICSILVLSGETKECDINSSEYRPDFVIENVGKLYELMVR